VTLNFAEMSVVKSRLSVTHGANFVMVSVSVCMLFRVVTAFWMWVVMLLNAFMPLAFIPSPSLLRHSHPTTCC